jgi:hypothetical protein
VSEHLDGIDDIGVDFLIVADGAQAVGGKLYVMGGGWSHLWLPAFPGRPPIPFAVALALRVPWNRTNQRFVFALDLKDADGQRVGDEPPVTGEMEQGRPPGLTPGSDQRVVLAFPIGSVFPKPGRYRFEVLVDGKVIGDTAIEVRQSPAGQRAQ